MGDVPAGLYEHLITDRFSRDLTSTAHDLIQIGALDPADAHEALARHIAGLTSRALRAAGGGDSAAVSRQVELANRIVAAIAISRRKQPTRTTLSLIPYASSWRSLRRTASQAPCRSRNDPPSRCPRVRCW